MKILCTTCGKQRACADHPHSRNPERAARHWMRENCHTRREPRYRCAFRVVADEWPESRLAAKEDTRK